tara:strand:+ start:1061 stop:1342 length:282 start_codon:yes stop_codon:yes gene_type:complete
MEKLTIPNLFRTDGLVQSEKAIDFAFKSLKSEWDYDDEFIMKISKQFECASEGNIFLYQFDGACGDINEGWKKYCEFRGIEHERDNNPFINEE